jgi:hypothetical protein
MQKASWHFKTPKGGGGGRLPGFESSKKNPTRRPREKAFVCHKIMEDELLYQVGRLEGLIPRPKKKAARIKRHRHAALHWIIDRVVCARNKLTGELKSVKPFSEIVNRYGICPCGVRDCSSTEGVILVAADTPPPAVAMPAPAPMSAPPALVDEYESDEDITWRPESDHEDDDEVSDSSDAETDDDGEWEDLSDRSISLLRDEAQQDIDLLMFK